MFPFDSTPQETLVSYLPTRELAKSHKHNSHESEEADEPQISNKKPHHEGQRYK